MRTVVAAALKADFTDGVAVRQVFFQHLPFLQEAEAVQAAGEAEAKAMSDKADALAKYGEAATQQMVLDKAPDIARALAEPMGSVKDMSIISTDGASALPKAVAGNVEQLDAIMRSLTGTGLTDMFNRIADDDRQTSRDRQDR